MDEAVFMKSTELWPGDDLSWFSFIYKAQADFSYQKMLEQLQDEQAGRNLEPNWVPATMLYAFSSTSQSNHHSENKIIGRYHIRHSLNDFLLQRGGNVGYAVAPGFRQQGIATQMMAKGTAYIKEKLGLSRILVTCTDSNTGSYKLIEKFGGVLENKVWDDEHGEMIRRYWMTL